MQNQIVNTFFTEHDSNPTTVQTVIIFLLNLIDSDVSNNCSTDVNLPRRVWCRCCYCTMRRWCQLRCSCLLSISLELYGKQDYWKNSNNKSISHRQDMFRQMQVALVYSINNRCLCEINAIECWSMSKEVQIEIANKDKKTQSLEHLEKELSCNS